MPDREQPEVPELHRKPTPLQRWAAARKWLWSSWIDEAPMVYRRSAQGKDRARILWVEFFLFLREVIRGFYAVHGTARAASLAYTTLLSLIPLIVALSQVLRGYFAKIFPDFRTQTDTLLNLIVPYQASQIAYHFNRFAENAEAASTFGTIAFLVISFRLFMAVEATINQIWHVQTWRGYRQKIRAFTMLFFWGPLLIGLSFTTTASVQRNAYLRMVFENDFILRAVPVVVLFIAFTMLFWLVPSTRVSLKSAALGALITTVLFELVRWGFGAYADHLFTGRLNVIYGTLGLLIIFLLALEILWVVILLGVQISYVHQNMQGILRASEKQIEDKPGYNLYFALRALIEISRRFDLREDPPSSYRLAEEFGATDTQMMIVLRKLEAAKLVKEVAGEWTGFVPGCDPDRITIEEVIRNMEGGSREIPDSDVTNQPAREAIVDMYDTLRRCTAAGLEHRTVGQLVRDIHGPRRPSRAHDLRSVE